MEKFTIDGKHRLKGKFEISGAKNAGLPILISSLLVNGEVTLHNLSQVSDISTTIELLRCLGAKIELSLDPYNNKKKIVKINSKTIDNCVAPYEIVSRMRASFLVLGPLLTRMGEAKVSLPGGCAIGKRPVDIHLKALEEMGAKITMENGFVNGYVRGKLKGKEIEFRLPSVGATQNIMMAATLAEGKTIIRNVSKEPETVDLANCLVSCGAKINGIGTNTLEIEGVEELHQTDYIVISDRLEAATYMIAALMTDGDCIISGIDFKYALGNVIELLEQIGANIEYLNDKEIRIRKKLRKLKPVHVVTDSFPGFPTDLQPQIMALLANIDGESSIDETVFENRFMHVPELNRMGADITTEGNKAFIHGKENCYTGTKVQATDLRAGAALILAGLTTKDATYVYNPQHVLRGYENIVEKLNNCGAQISLD